MAGQILRLVMIALKSPHRINGMQRWIAAMRGFAIIVGDGGRPQQQTQ